MTIFTTYKQTTAKFLAIFTAVMMIMSLVPMQVLAAPISDSEPNVPRVDATQPQGEAPNSDATDTTASTDPIVPPLPTPEVSAITTSPNDLPKSDDTIKVHILKFLQSGDEMTQVPNDSDAPEFPMNATWSAENIGSGSGNYVLGNYHGQEALKYAADTSAMSTPADYTTHEITADNAETSVVLPWTAKCSEGRYRLIGYKSGDDLESALASEIDRTAPGYTKLTTDKTIIVINEKCGAPVVAPTCAMGNNLIQNGSFENTPTVTANGGKWQIFSSISNWLVGLSDGVEVWHNFNGTGNDVAADGAQNVELDGNDATNLSQAIMTVPGATYELKFDYSARAHTGLDESKMDTMINGVPVALTTNTDGTTATANVWEPRATSFVATGASTTISFEDKGIPDDNGGLGPLLDNVSVCMTKPAKTPDQCTLTMVSNDSVVVGGDAYATSTYSGHPSWTAMIPGATWIWDSLFVTDPHNDQIRTFTETFTVNNPTSADLEIAADNSYEVYVNNVLATSSTDEDNYHDANKDMVSLLPFLVSGNNTLRIEVKNWALAGSNAYGNPAGLLFKLVVKGDKDESCKVTTKPTPHENTGSLQIMKYACPATTTITRSENGVTGSVPAMCTPQAGATFGYVHGTQTDANSPYPELTMPLTAAGASNASGTLTVTHLPSGGRYLVEETNASGTKIADGDILGLFCEGDGDHSNTNDNQELTFVPIDGVAHCVAYNKMSTIVVIDPTPTTTPTSTVPMYKLDGYKHSCEQDGGYYCYTPLANWTITATDGTHTMSTTTDSNGYYYFNVPAGNWTVAETQQSGWTQVQVAENENVLEDATTCTFEVPSEINWSEQVTRFVWQPHYQCDFGNAKDESHNPIDPITYFVTGQKWNDLNSNGVKDSGETGLAGWTITATNANNSGDFATTTTDSSGNYYFHLLAGHWNITEGTQDSWTQVAVTQDGQVVTGAGTGVRKCTFNFGQSEAGLNQVAQIAVASDGTCDFYNHQTVTTATTTSIITKSSNNRSGGSTGTKLPLITPQGLVLGASTTTVPVCGMYLEDYMRLGNAASSTQIIKLQIFLNAVGIKLAVTGVFDAATDAAVRAFQAAHKAEVLTPWFLAGIVPHENPTGWVYQLTRWKINNMVCPGSEAYPVLKK